MGSDRPTATLVLDTDGTGTFEQHTPHIAPCHHGEVPAPSRWTQVRTGLAAPEPAPGRRLRDPHPGLVASVVVAIQGVACGLSRLDEGSVERVIDQVRRDRLGTTATSVLGLPAVEPLSALEVRQHPGVIPTGASQFGPSVEVRRVATDPDHAVDRAPAAQDAPCHPWHALVESGRVR